MKVLALHLRSLFISAVAIGTMFCSSSVLASSITVSQQDPAGSGARWTLTSPSGVSVSDDAMQRDFTETESGTYIFSITPKTTDAVITTTVKQGTTVIANSNSQKFSVVLAANQTYSLTITFAYSGIVNVTSDPSGVPFEMLIGGTTRLTGITPHTFTEVQPSLIKVTFARREGCGPMGQQQRILKPGTTMTFFGQFVCTESTISSSSAPAVYVAPASIDANEGRTLNIWVAAQQSEVLPGSITRFTITVKNTGTRTVHNLLVSAQGGSNELEIISPVQRNGDVYSGTATWAIPELLAGKYWSVTVPVTVTKNVQHATPLSFTTRVSAADLARTGNGLMAVTSVNTVTSLPQTGASFDILFLLLTTSATAVCAAMTRRSKEATARV